MTSQTYCLCMKTYSFLFLFRFSCYSGGGVSSLLLLLYWYCCGELPSAGTLYQFFDWKYKSTAFFFRSSWLRFQMINMRMNRHFKNSPKMRNIRVFIDDCKLGDWFVLYQLSKNLNRPFFMDFLTQLSAQYNVRYMVNFTIKVLSNSCHWPLGMRMRRTLTLTLVTT